MAAPGVASLSAPPAPGERQTTYDNSWVNQPPDPMSLNENPQLSVDISERKLGASPWFDNDGNPTPPRQAGHLQRQQERQAARKAEMRKRMGLANIKDEQKARGETQGTGGRQSEE